MTYDVYVNTQLADTVPSAAPALAAVQVAETLADQLDTHYVKIRVTGDVAIVDLFHFPSGQMQHDRIVSVPEGALRTDYAKRVKEHPVISGVISREVRV